ncbi:uncharacterized protein LOC144139306 [Haemaphysalis longicornis]
MYNDSVDFCKERNMTVLSQRHLSGEEEKLLLTEQTDKSFWVVPSGRGIVTYAASCAGAITQADAGCLQVHNAVCSSDNIKDTSGTTVPLQKCYGCQDPMIRLTGVSEFFQNSLKEYEGYFYLQDILHDLKRVADEIYSSDDFEVLPYFLGRIVESWQKIQTCRGEEEKADGNKKIGDTLAKIVEKAMLKTKILKGVPEDRRVRTASCLFSILEDFSLQKNLSTRR